MTVLTGRESSVLALLARSRGTLEGHDLVRLLSSLSGPARRVGVAIVTGRGTAASVLAARGFTEWADSLGRGGRA